MCVPDLGEDELERMEVPADWPTHLKDTIQYLNNRILLLLGYSPVELMFGVIVNTLHTPMEVAQTPVDTDNVILQAAYAQQQCLDGYSYMVEHAFKRKAAFDKKVMSCAPREVIFMAGQLVQVYRNNLDFTVLVGRKMEPKWSAPCCVLSRDRNSYKLQTLDGLVIGSRFSVRRLCRFIPRMGTVLHEAQKAVEVQLGIAEEAVDKVGAEVEESDMGKEEGTVEDIDGDVQSIIEVVSGDVEEGFVDDMASAKGKKQLDEVGKNCGNAVSAADSASESGSDPGGVMPTRPRRSEHICALFSRVLGRGG